MNKSDENKIRTILIEAMEEATEKIAEEETVILSYWHANLSSRMAESALQIILSLEETEEERQEQE